MGVKQSIILQETYFQNGRWFQMREQICYDERVHTELLPYDIGTIMMNCDTHFYKVVDGDKTYYLPDSICCKSDCTPNPLFKGFAHEYYGNKHQDQTKDYITTVRKEMGIDIKKSYVAQHNGERVIKYARKLRKDKWDHNRYLEDTNLKCDHLNTACDCNNDDNEPQDPNDFLYE